MKFGKVRFLLRVTCLVVAVIGLLDNIGVSCDNHARHPKSEELDGDGDDTSESIYPIDDDEELDDDDREMDDPDSDSDWSSASSSSRHNFHYSHNSTVSNNCSDADKERKKDAYSYLYTYLTGKGVHSFGKEIRIGFLTPYNKNQFHLGAMSLAVEAVNRNPDLLPNTTLKFNASDIGHLDIGRQSSKSGLQSLPIRMMTEMRDEGCVAFIGGPEDTCESEALVAAAWNLPIISYKCADHQVSDKTTYATFARTLPPLSKVSKSVVSLLQHFQWNKIVLVVSPPMNDRFHSVVVESFTGLCQTHKINITDVYPIPDYIPEKFQEMKDIVTRSYERTRVYVFVGEYVALIDLMRAMSEYNLFDKGKYVILSVDDKQDLQNFGDIGWIRMNWTRESQTSALRSVLKLTRWRLPPNYKVLDEQAKNYSSRWPFCVPHHGHFFATSQVGVETAHLYDAVMIYAHALDKVLREGGDPRNGAAVMKHIFNNSYHSILGNDVYVDQHGDAEGNYTVAAYLFNVNDVQQQHSDDRSSPVHHRQRSMQPVGHFLYTPAASSRNSEDIVIPRFEYLDLKLRIDWLSGSDKPPLAEPECGFDGEKCNRNEWTTRSVAIIIFTFIVTVAFAMAFRHYRYEQKLACLLWKIDMKDVIQIPTWTTATGGSFTAAAEKGTVALCRQLLGSTVDTDAPLELSHHKRAYTQIGFYKGTVVAIKQVNRNVDLTRNIRKELKQIRELRHENIIPFIGASVEHGQVCILTGYCARGSLQDVLANEDLHLDNMFVASLVADLIKGMIYLHDSDIISHGNLKSSNCLVDSRWVLQISDFGLHEFKGGHEKWSQFGIEACKMDANVLIWSSPELLRDPNRLARGTQKSDIFSFGIILYELIGRAGPWGHVTLSPLEIIEKVRQRPVSEKPFRPVTSGLGCSDAIIRCLHSCWEEDPELRPDFRFIRIRLKEMQAGLKPNIFDNMLAIMEKYACNLEDIVQERTMQLMEEKKKTDALLHRMLPRSVADSLKRGERVTAEHFDLVTIYFSDVVGFTVMSAESTPMQVVELLNDLYTCFDSIISGYDVYKVETIGDAYMVVSGLPIKNGIRHAGQVASMALHLLKTIQQSFAIRHRPGERLKLRIGIHSGPVVTGVVGLKMPRYCLFGDTVNTASRMESSGSPLKIHVSEVTKNLLEQLGGYKYSDRGIIPIKGKGEMRTYWLEGEDPPVAMAAVNIPSDVTTPVPPSPKRTTFVDTGATSSLSQMNNNSAGSNHRHPHHWRLSPIARLRSDLHPRTEDDEMKEPLLENTHSCKLLYGHHEDSCVVTGHSAHPRHHHEHMLTGASRGFQSAPIVNFMATSDNKATAPTSLSTNTQHHYLQNEYKFV